MKLYKIKVLLKVETRDTRENGKSYVNFEKDILRKNVT